MLPGKGLAAPGVLDLAVRKRLPCLLGFPRRAPNPPVPIDFMEAKAVSLNVLQTHLQSAALVGGLFGCSHSTARRYHGLKHKQKNWFIAVCSCHLVLLEAYLRVCLTAWLHHWAPLLSRSAGPSKNSPNTSTCLRHATWFYQIVCLGGVEG